MTAASRIPGHLLPVLALLLISSAELSTTATRPSRCLCGYKSIPGAGDHESKRQKSTAGMERSNSFGTSWADQWDTGSDPTPVAPHGHGHGGKAGVGGVGEKTKAAAAAGLRKVKEGTAHGFQWIKDKYQKKSNGGKKQQQGSEVEAGHY